MNSLFARIDVYELQRFLDLVDKFLANPSKKTQINMYCSNLCRTGMCVLSPDIGLGGFCNICPFKADSICIFNRDCMSLPAFTLKLIELKAILERDS